MRKLICKIKDCNRPVNAKELCSRHYDKNRYHNGKKRKKQLLEYSKQPEIKKIVMLRHRKPSYRYSALKRAAKDLKLGFNITKEQYFILLKQQCSYCGGDLNPLGHGLDRKDSSKGYLIENVVSCCADCNSIKTNILTYEEMKEAMKAVLKVRESAIR